MVTLRNLYERIDCSNTKMNLIAGAGGLDKEIRWVHMVENMEISSFLSGRELIFITGVAVGRNVNLLKLIQSIWKHDAGGVVLNTGPYILGITEEIISFCDQRAFPLFEVPWEVRMADIMRDFCIQILQSGEHTASNVKMALKHMIYFPQESSLYISCLEQHGLHRDEKYCVASLRFLYHAFSADVQGVYMRLLKLIKTVCFNAGIRAETVMVENAMLLIFAGTEASQIKFVVERVFTEAAGFAAAEGRFYISVGSLEEGILSIHGSCKRARQIEELQIKMNSDQGILFYEDMKIYKLLFEIGDAKAMKRFYQDTLEPLVLYDQLNKTDYVQVLELYLRHNGSIKYIAETLYVHRNTIHYKIKKIEKILQCDLSDLEARILYKLSYMVKNLI